MAMLITQHAALAMNIGLIQADAADQFADFRVDEALEAAGFSKDVFNGHNLITFRPIGGEEMVSNGCGRYADRFPLPTECFARCGGARWPARDKANGEKGGAGHGSVGRPGPAARTRHRSPASPNLQSGRCD